MFLTCSRLAFINFIKKLFPNWSTLYFRFITDNFQESPFCSSAVIPFKSPLISLIETLFLFPLHITGIINSNSLVRIHLLEEHQETEDPSRAIEIELQSSKLQISSGVLKIWSADLAWGLGITYNMYHHPVASMILGVASILTILCLLAALALSKFLSPQKVVITSTPLQRNRSNHDLADRQARARLNLEYKARMDQAGRLQCSRSDLVMNKEDQFGDEQAVASWTQPPLHLTEVGCHRYWDLDIFYFCFQAVQRLDLPQAEATEQHPKIDWITNYCIEHFENLRNISFKAAWKVNNVSVPEEQIVTLAPWRTNCHPCSMLRCRIPSLSKHSR